MHVDHLTIALLPANYCGDKHQSIPGDEVSYASFVSLMMAHVSLEVEFESRGDGGEGGEDGKAGKDGAVSHGHRETEDVPSTLPVALKVSVNFSSNRTRYCL